MITRLRKNQNLVRYLLGGGGIGDNTERKDIEGRPTGEARCTTGGRRGVGGHKSIGEASGGSQVQYKRVDGVEAAIQVEGMPEGGGHVQYRRVEGV
jgi:hypothetical protein